MRFSTNRTVALAAAGVTLALSMTACGGSSDTTAAASKSKAPSSPAGTTPMAADAPFGAGCAAVPAGGSGSFDGMAKDPVATAASHNPVLSTLVTAVTKAGLVDTLNSADGITVFAPVNDAFAAIPPKTLKAVLKDKETLTKILTHHVIAGQLSPDQLAGEHETLAGDMLTVEGSGEDFMVGAEKATVLCGNVPTANATVYIIDTVLMPKM